MPLNQITLIGVGLIGGSFVLDLKRQRLVRTVIGIDTRPANLERALERRVIDTAASQITPQAVRNSDLVLIATPVAAMPAICQALAPLLSARTIVSDVGSTKQSALAAFAQHLPQHYPRCVAFSAPARLRLCAPNAGPPARRALSPIRRQRLSRLHPHRRQQPRNVARHRPCQPC